MNSEAPAGGTSAGSLLRAAREQQGLHIAALAAAIKVSPRKLEALENDRYEEMAGATFTRALAQSVCRALRIDAQPVLALLPQPEAVGLDQVMGSLNAPFNERPARDDPGVAAITQRSLVWAGLALFVAAVVTYFLPASWLRWGSSEAAHSAAPSSSPAGVAASAPSVAVATPALAASAPAASAPVPSTVTGARSAASSASILAPAAVVPGATPASAGAIASLPATLPSPAPASLPSGQGPAPSGALQLSASETTWIEVRDGAGRVVFSRTLTPGESAGVDGVPPLRAVIGNARATTVTYRGQPVALTVVAPNNVARVELK